MPARLHRTIYNSLTTYRTFVDTSTAWIDSIHAVELSTNVHNIEWSDHSRLRSSGVFHADRNINSRTPAVIGPLSQRSQAMGLCRTVKVTTINLPIYSIKMKHNHLPQIARRRSKTSWRARPHTLFISPTRTIILTTWFATVRKQTGVHGLKPYSSPRSTQPSYPHGILLHLLHIVRRRPVTNWRAHPHTIIIF